MDKDCGCRVLTGLADVDAPLFDRKDCRFPAVVAELDSQVRFNELFADKLNEFGTIDRLVEAYSAQKMRIRELEQFCRDIRGVDDCMCMCCMRLGAYRYIEKLAREDDL